MDKIVGVGKERIDKNGKKHILVYWRPAKGSDKVFRWVQAETRLEAHYKRQELIAGYDGSSNGSGLAADFGKAREELKRTLTADKRPKKTIQLYDGTFARLFIDFKEVHETKHKIVITSPLQLDSSYVHEYKDHFCVDLGKENGWRAELIRIKSILKKLKVKKFCSKNLLYDVREELPTPQSNTVSYRDIPDSILLKLIASIKPIRRDYWRIYYYMYLTGRRPTESTFYERRDVPGSPIDPKELHIRREITKTKKDSIIYLQGDLKALIMDALRGNNTKWLFPNRHGRKCQKDGIYKWFKKYNKKWFKEEEYEGIDGKDFYITPKHFRKRFHTKKIPLSMKDAMAISGLKDTRVAMEHYAYSTPEGQAKILAKTK